MSLFAIKNNLYKPKNQHFTYYFEHSSSITFKISYTQLFKFLVFSQIFHYLLSIHISSRFILLVNKAVQQILTIFSKQSIRKSKNFYFILIDKRILFCKTFIVILFAIHHSII